MSQPDAYEVHQLCFTGDTTEIARGYAESWLGKEMPVYDRKGDPVLAADGINYKNAPFFEAGAKWTFIEELPNPDGGVLLIYKVIGQRVPDFVFERARSV